MGTRNGTPEDHTHAGRERKGGMKKMKCEEGREKGWRAGKRKGLSSARESLLELSALASDRAKSDAKVRVCSRAEKRNVGGQMPIYM